MRGKGVLRESSRHGNFSKEAKIASKGKGKVRPENVVLIDLDDDNVVIIDDVIDAEPSQKNFGEHGKSSVEGVITIDDDDDDDEDDDDDDDEDDDDDDSDVGPGVRVEADRDLVSDASSSKSRFPTFKTMGSSVNNGRNECDFVKEKTSSFQFSKCKQTYCTSSKSPARNHYGLDSSFDKDSTDSDSSDCEIVADSHGKLREQWERASIKRKHVAKNRHSRSEDQSSVSESNNEAKTKRTAEEKTKEKFAGSANPDCMREKNQPGFFFESEFFTHHVKPSAESPFVDQKYEGKPGSVQEKEFCQRSGGFQPGEGSGSGVPHDSCGCQSEKNVFGGSFGNKGKDACPQEGSVAEHCSFCNACNYKNISSCYPFLWAEKELSPLRSPLRPFEEKVGDKQSTHPTTSSVGEENLDFGKPFVPNFSLFDETTVESSVPRHGENFEDIVSQRVSTKGKSKVSRGKDSNQEVRANSNGAAVLNSARDGPSNDQNESSFLGVNSSNDNVKCAQEVPGTPPVKDCVITDREKFKDTEEFKRAIEQEWAARQRELQLQSEEAQRLRKRKKAETMRLDDIERRQRQRVEEVRQTQKKNAEDINLKEKFRGDIKTEINRLETTCIDMASLLRGLGIMVNGAHDVNAAYKRALLKFHPDRASRIDIRQQVEAEEKFKLISRMKEKFLTSCC